MFNNILRSFFSENVYPDSTNNLQAIAKSKLEQEDKHEVPFKTIKDVADIEGYYNSKKFKLLINQDYYNSDDTYIIRNHNSTFYIKNRKLHREDGPAAIWYDENIIVVERYYINGKTHRDDGPAVIYYKNGRPHIEQYWYDGVEDEEYYV